MKVRQPSSDDEFIEKAKACGVFAFDIEHDPSTEFNFADFPDLFWGVGFSTFDGDNILAYFVKDKDRCKHLLEELKDQTHVAYNGKYDMKCLLKIGVLEDYPENFFDPMVAVNLLDDNRRPNQIGLKIVIKDYYNVEMMQFKEASKGGRHSDLFERYAIDDVVWELVLYKDLLPKLREQGLEKLFNKILMPVSKVFADMEMVGMFWDKSRSKDLLIEFASKREELRSEILSEIGELNLNSGDQLAARLFDELGYSTRGIDMTRSGSRYSTDAKAMETLAKKYPVCNKIVQFRLCDKLIGTYIEPLTRRSMDDPEGRIHPTYWIVSSTGRTRCEKPNLQNLPSFLPKGFEHLSIRKCFVPEPGNSLVVADLSQIELRVATHISQDPMFMKAYCGYQCKSCGCKGMETSKILRTCPQCGEQENEKTGFWHGLDLHSMTSENVPALKGNRQAGKQANFALIYMATARRMHETYPDMSIGDWNDAIDQFMQTYEGIRKWHVQSEYLMKDSGVARDIFGRKRRISKKEIRLNFKHCLNQFVNFPVQSSACALIELSLVKLRERLSGEWMRGVKPINFVHDEIVLEVEDSLLDEVKPHVIDCLENTVQLRVPVRADMNVVQSWGDAK